MREIMRTNDLVVLSYARAVLHDAAVVSVVLDANMSVMEGSIGMFPRRLMVADDDEQEAKRLLQEADLGKWLLDV